MSELVSPFSLTDVRNQFGTSTASALTNDSSMRNMYQDILGTTSGGRLSDFSGTGRPQATNQTIGQECATGSFRPIFNGNIDFYGGATNTGDCHYRWKYDTDPLFPSPSYTSTQTTSSNGSVSGSPNSFDFSDGNTVYCVMQIWNEYNDEAESDYVETSQEQITFSGTTLSDPAINSFEVQGDGDVIFNFDYNNIPNSFDIEVQIDDNGTWVAESFSFESSSNWGTSTNPKTGTWQLDGLPNPGDTYRARIKAEAPNGCYNDSLFTSYFQDTV